MYFGKKMNLHLDLIPYIKINSRWIIDLKGNSKTIKVLTKENSIINLHKVFLIISVGIKVSPPNFILTSLSVPSSNEFREIKSVIKTNKEATFCLQVSEWHTRI